MRSRLALVLPLVGGLLSLGLGLSGCGAASPAERPGGGVHPPAPGHESIVLRDRMGDPLQAASTEPYSPRKTCGVCHDVDAIANGYHFQQGRTDALGAIQMKPDFFGDGRFFIHSDGMYGKWGPPSTDSSQLAALTNASASDIDKTSYWMAGLCAMCHPGGGNFESDRQDDRYFDVETGFFGYETRSEAYPGDLDGDYGEVTTSGPGTGTAHLAPWDVTGVLEPDCLYCHRVDRNFVVESGEVTKNLNWIFRAATLRAKAALTDSGANPVPAYAAAPAAGQGWGTVALAAGVKPPLATTFDIDYTLGLGDGSLVEDGDGNLRVSLDQITHEPKDLACWGCHVTADRRKRGRTWFDPDEDVHYRHFNDLDGTPTEAEKLAAIGTSTACQHCHGVTGTPENAFEHNFAKGNANLGTVRDDTDYYEFNTCRDCHLDGADPDAPKPVNSIHTDKHLAKMDCSFCHIPLKHASASLVIDNVSTGTPIDYDTDVFLSADPLDPANPDKSAWFPSAKLKRAKDGVMRLYPDKLLLSSWLGDWDDKTGDGPSSDDVIQGVYLWRVRAMVATAGLSATDDNGDGQPEVNTAAEIQQWLQAAKTTHDQAGTVIALNPVLVKGGDVWYLQGGSLESFEIGPSGIKVESEHPFSTSHNVLPLSQGLTLGKIGCGDCHTSFNGGNPTKVFDRLILVDPFDQTGESLPGAGDGAQPVYSTLRLVSGVSPF
ncbi:MAG: hypothetical protein ACC662_06895 [Planctomycetota bacterium]